jgi:glyceraldehyde 3-phosphate dehydrogenase
MYGNNMVNKSVTDLMKAHRFVRQVEMNELSEFDSAPMLDAIARLQLGPAHLDLGKMMVKFQQGGNGRSLEEFVSDELANIIGSSIKPLPQPQDVVLYGFGRIGRLVARILIDKAGGGDVLRTAGYSDSQGQAGQRSGEARGAAETGLCSWLL